MASRMLRGAIVGASSLLGRELAEQLNEASGASWDITLLDAEDATGQVTAAGNEPLVIQPLAPGAFDRMDIVFFAGDAPTVRTHWREAQEAGAGVVDLTGTLTSEPGIRVLAPDVSTAAIDLTTTAVVSAHPAALMLALAPKGVARAVAVPSESSSVDGSETRLTCPPRTTTVRTLVPLGR